MDDIDFAMEEEEYNQGELPLPKAEDANGAKKGKIGRAHV